MKLLEVKNNLVKLAYEDGESPILGRFVILASNTCSYVAQFVNLKSDNTQSFGIARLLFTFTSDGVVDDYDGSTPSMNSEVSLLDASELLDILPIETAIKIGNLAQQEDILNVDVSVFENNLVVFSEQNSDKSCVISNFARQLFQLKEKVVVIDNEKMFEGYNKIQFAEDFKLPLNSQAIDFLFEYELTEVDQTTKAVIQDIFYNVQEYINTLEDQFLPIDKFVEVVSAQYKETQMPELALLKNKLLKYRDENIFANSKEEFLSLFSIIEDKNCAIIDINNAGDALQKLLISFIHSELDKFDQYIYLFAMLNDNNSDKKLIKQFINHDHIFTTIFVSSSYKYAKELKENAQNIMLFSPAELTKDMSVYAPFLNKLNSTECVVYGTLTHDIPFIVSVNDLELALTKDDVFGEKYRFVPVSQDMELVNQDGVPVLLPSSQKNNESEIVEVVQEPEETEQLEQSDEEVLSEEYIEEPVEEDLSIEEESNDVFEGDVSIDEDEEEVISVDELGHEDFNSNAENISDLQGLTEEDLDYIENSDVETINFSDLPQTNEPPPAVPVYPAEEYEEEVVSDFAQGDTVNHPRYGRGVVEKIIKYGNKVLCSISFDNVGRRLLDPSISEFEKI